MIIADKSLVDRLARLRALDPVGMFYLDALTEAHRSGQLVTLAECEARVAAAWEAAAVIVESNMLCRNNDGSEVILPRTNPGNKLGLAYAAAIRAAATGAKEGE